MNRLLTAVALMVICGICLGFYLGWFHIGSDNAGDSSHITLTVEQKKIQDDEKKALEKVHSLTHPAKE